MKTFYIKGTKKRYSIGDDGNIVRHYKYNKNKIRIYSDLVLSKHYNTKKRGRYFSPCSSMLINGKTKLFFINSLMIKYFKLLPPDEMHQYKLGFIDGDNSNNALTNLRWEIYTVRAWNFQPIATHKKGIVVSKVCGECGENLDIINFTYSCIPTHKGSKSKKNCYRNICECCRSSARWQHIKNSPKLAAINAKRQREWSQSEKGKEFYSNYNVEYRATLPKSYVRQIAKKRGINLTNMNDEAYDIIRTSIKITKESRLQ